MAGRTRLRRHLEIIHPDSAGIDVGSREMWVAIPADRERETVRRFGMFTDDLEAIRDWLRTERITTVAMESTGVYWIPLYDVLSSVGVEVCLVNPRELKSVPSRKSDLKDCQWLQELHAFGLLRASFRPDDQACRVRSLVRQRQELIDAAARQVQLMQKAMTQMNIRLTEVVADITGKTGMGIIWAILSGERSPQTLVEFRDRRCKHDADTFGRALVGTWRSEHLLALSHAVTLWDTYQRLINETEAAIKSAVDARPNSAQDGTADDAERPLRRTSKSDYKVDIVTSWKKASDVDLTEIDGISDSTASIIMAEVGLNIDRFATPGRFASWLGLCPAHDISGGRCSGAGRARAPIGCPKPSGLPHRRRVVRRRRWGRSAGGSPPAPANPWPSPPPPINLPALSGPCSPRVPPTSGPQPRPPRSVTVNDRHTLSLNAHAHSVSTLPVPCRLRQVSWKAP